MNHKFITFLIVIYCLSVLVGCKTSTLNQNQTSTDNATQPSVNQVQNGATADNITGGKDADGFVRLPGEPSRGDSTYYITSEICQQFTKEFMESLLGKKIYKAEPSYIELTNCQYDLDENGANILLSLSFLSIDNQVKGHQILDRQVAPDASIPMDNYVVKQDNGLINEIYLVLGANKFLSINRSSGKALSEQEVLALAQKLGQKIKNFK
jgi:hypothetical protein